MATTPRKPENVQLAQLVLLAWIPWVCLFNSWTGWLYIDETTQKVNNQFLGLITFEPDEILNNIYILYAVVAAVSAWVILGLGRGKQWARSSVLWSLVLQAIITPLPPFHHLLEYLGDIPDLGLQLFATILLYRPASRAWFEEKNAPKRSAKTGL